MRIEDMVERSVKLFDRHEARYSRGWFFDILDWKFMDSRTCWIRMVFDHERDDTNAIYISGDLGEAVVYPTFHSSLRNMADAFTWRDNDGRLCIRPHYFIEKVKASSDLYDWDMEYFQEDLLEKHDERYGKTADATDLNAFFAEYCDGWKDSILLRDGAFVTDRFAQEDLKSIFSDYEEWIHDCGRRVNERVVCWLVAARLAYEQMESSSERKENDARERDS